MEKNGWKILAIIFIVLFVLETGYFIWVLSYSSDYYGKESECAYNICEVGTEHEAYAYDEYEQVCYCFDGGEQTYQKYIG